jgi:LVIVD repeat
VRRVQRAARGLPPAPPTQRPDAGLWSYWDSGLRIVDVTDPAHPVEVGSFDYPGLPGNCCAHYAAPTPSGNWVYQEDEIGTGGSGGVHVLNTHACDGTSYCYPVQVGFWHINGHPVQAAAVNSQGSGAINGVFQRYFTWDAHNLDVKGEDTLLVANYTMGIRLVDTSDKASPAETAFYLPNADKSEACVQACYFQGRETWGAYFGSDGNIYASDFWLGFSSSTRASERETLSAFVARP